jgi:hypothetical protein
MVIKINGSAQRSFYFPAEKSKAFLFYQDYECVLRLFPHISVVKVFAPGLFRMLYHTIEMGLYHIHIYCDLQASADPANGILRFGPVTSFPPKTPAAGFTSTQVQGKFTSTSKFYADGKQTRIDYMISLQVELPVPRSALIMPAKVREHIANAITQGRIGEISDGFIERSVKIYDRTN